MKGKIKNIIGIILIMGIIIISIMSYPWFVSVNEYGETTCSNLFGKVTKCQ